MKITGNADYYYIRVNVNQNENKYYDVVIRFEDVPNIIYSPFPYNDYVSYVLGVYEAYCHNKEYHYCSLWAKYNNCHLIIGEHYSAWGNPFYYDTHTEVKEFFAMAN